MAKNSLQAVLDRQQVRQEPPPVTAPTTEPKNEVYDRPSRRQKRLIGGHFEPKVAKQMRILAAEEDTTVQALLEEALDLLFVKKGRGRVIGV